MPMIKKWQGFTLIELMVVVAIVGILAAVAYPSYRDSVMKSRRADAKAVLTQAAMWMERFATNHNSYDQTSEIDEKKRFAVASGLTKAPIESTTKYYDISLAANASTFTLTATPIADTSQADDGCGALTLTNTGAKGAPNFVSPMTVDACWR